MEEGLPLNELLMAEEVMKVHYSNMVGLIPLSKTLHLMVHGENAEKVVIPAYMIFGNYKKFIEEYGDYMNDEDFKKIERLIQRTKEIKESDYKFLEQHYDYIEVDGFKQIQLINPDELFKKSKGFCLHHFRDLVEVGEKKLNDKQKSEFFPVLFDLMEKNMKRLEEEVTWFCDKQDYLNKDKDWGNSRDSVQRAMQKLGGGYPADPVFKMNY